MKMDRKYKSKHGFQLQENTSNQNSCDEVSVTMT